MKYIFIVNPVSGKKDSDKVIKRITEYCFKNNIDFEIEITKCNKDAMILTKKHKKDKAVIFAVGGDGTLFEVVNGIIGSNNKLGLIPNGSGNDFYKTIKELNITEEEIDLCKVNDIYSINTASIGIDAEVGINAGIMKEKGVNPKHIYNRSIIYTFLSFKKKLLEIEVKDNIKIGKFMMLSVCNGRYYGGGYKIAPEADLHDHYLDLYYVQGINKFQVPKMINKLKKGTLESDKHVTHMLINKLVLKSKTPLKCCVDGETIIDKTFRFKVIKNAVTFYNDKELIKYIIGE